jgi:FkbM family methyltransferase
MNNAISPTSPRQINRISYAQNHEDILLDRVFKNQAKGTYVDVGANHPVLDSNTYFFYRRGWRGYNFEPLKHLHEKFLEQRPEDHNLAIALSDSEGALPFYEISSCDGLSTLSAEVADHHRRRGLEVIEHQIPVRTLASLIEELHMPAPDFLSIDVEGLEEKVIRGIPFATWRPKVLVIESTLPETNIASHKAWEPTLLANGYLFAVFNGINRFYLREDLADRLPALQVPINVLDCFRPRDMVDLENQIYDLKNQLDQVHAAWESDVGRYESMRPDWEYLQELCGRLGQYCNHLNHQNSRLAEYVNDRENQLVQRQMNWQREANWQLDALTRQNQELREAADEQVQALARQNEELQGDLSHIRNAFGEQLERLNARFQLVAAREQELREMLLDAHEQLLRRDEEIQSALVQALPAGNAVRQRTGSNAPLITGAIAAAAEHVPAAPAPAPTPPLEPATHTLPTSQESDPYTALISQIRELVRLEVPQEATVLVASEGDEELLDLDGRKAWHYPCSESGDSWGDYPIDSANAIALLESLRSRGAGYFIVPTPALWILDRYRPLQEHLNERYAVAARGECGIIYALSGRNSNGRDVRPQRGVTDGGVRPFGVNIAGNIGSEKGTGEAVRATIRSVAAAGVPFVLNNVVDDYSDNPDRTYTEFSADNPYGINIIQANADMVAPFVKQAGEEYLRGRYNIGYWFWELSDFPKQEWQDSFQYLDETWVGSNFVLDAVSRVAPVPVVKIPVSLPEHLPVKACGRDYFGLPEDKFVFLFIVDFMSIPERKNPHGLIRAFKKAFAAHDGAMLVIKGAHSSPQWLEAVGAPPNILEAISAAARDTNIRIIDRVMTREEVNALMALADCYVSLHRSEGFGLPLAEAMNLERPVIATSYSGNMDFMTPANSFLVQYDLVELEQDFGPYRKGCVWAEPDLDHAAELMRHVYTHRDNARSVGQRARRDIVRLLHPRVTGEFVRQRLRRIAESGRCSLTPLSSIDTPRPEPVASR